MRSPLNSISLGAEKELTIVYGGLAMLVVVALVGWFVLSPEHSTRARLLVAGVFGLTFIVRYVLPQFALATIGTSRRESALLIPSSISSSFFSRRTVEGGQF